ncbi:MAG TPA: hypothetical protein VM686_08690 [Polyangiaceae bacterium]|nr:hypothetical protein [Polyangiaceae bacterium]
MGLQLTPLGTLTLAMGASITLPNGPSGLRVLVEFLAITWEGKLESGAVRFEVHEVV